MGGWNPESGSGEHSYAVEFIVRMLTSYGIHNDSGNRSDLLSSIDFIRNKLFVFTELQ